MTGEQGGIQCPYCASRDTKTVSTHSIKRGVRLTRRRLCAGCGRDFATYEIVVGKKLPVDQDQLGRLIDHLVQISSQAQRVLKRRHIEDGRKRRRAA